MGTNNKYYWIKLNTNFFIQREVKSIRRTENGLLYIVIYLKLLLLSANTGGLLIFENTEDNLIEELSIEIDEEYEDVTNAIKILQKKNLININSNDEFFLNKAPDMVGSETAAAERMRRSRAKKKEIEKNVTMLQDVTNCYTDKDKDKEIDKDIKIDDDKAKYISEINNLIKNKISSSSLDNFINRFGVNKLDPLISEIKDSDYLKGNINFNNLSDDFIDKAISGKYKTYKNDDSSNDEDEVNIYAGVEPIRGYIK